MQPFIYMSTHSIKEGKQEDIRTWYEEFEALVEEKEPRLIASHLFVNEPQTEGTILLLHPDAESMDFHLQLTGDKIGEGLELAPVESIQIYGSPGPVLKEVLRRNQEAGVSVSVTPRHLGGFSRSAA